MSVGERVAAVVVEEIARLHYAGRVKPDALVVGGEVVPLPRDVGCPTCLTVWPCPTARVIQAGETAGGEA